MKSKFFFSRFTKTLFYTFSLSKKFLPPSCFQRLLSEATFSFLLFALLWLLYWLTLSQSFSLFLPPTLSSCVCVTFSPLQHLIQRSLFLCLCLSTMIVIFFHPTSFSFVSVSFIHSSVSFILSHRLQRLQPIQHPIQRYNIRYNDTTSDTTIQQFFFCIFFSICLVSIHSLAAFDQKPIDVKVELWETKILISMG